MYYVQETDKPNILLNLFNILQLDNDKIILPIKKKEILNFKKADKLAKKTSGILKKTGSKAVVLSKNIKLQKEYIKKLNEYGIEIIDGRWLFAVISSKVLEYVVKKKKLKKEETNVSILVNDNSKDYIIENIKDIIRTYKNVNIVTTHIEKFKKLEEDILEKEGIMITITNNKKKSLMKSNIILNLDFKEEEINKYNIPDEAIIINIKENVKIYKKRFNGLNINDYEIDFEEYEKFDYDKNNYYFQKDIYEAELYKKQPYEYIERKIKKDKVKIIKLVGNKTIL